jgi:hypothetical protein
MSNGQRQQMRLSPEQMAQLQEEERQVRLEIMQPQVDINGVDRVCMHCRRTLNPIHNPNYDGSTGGFCNMLCAKAFEVKQIEDGMSEEEAGNEREKYEDWKPKRHSPVV